MYLNDFLNWAEEFCDNRLLYIFNAQKVLFVGAIEDLPSIYNRKKIVNYSINGYLLITPDGYKKILAIKLNC